ncbi:hypothetical protein MTR67_018887 [Solanum verrucosum]|uniref:Reverse transcriptase zinc-binding domain-containing protein n=1 Tax=Solanum verrucosum TaxID=315347 RepID=A0AAF0QML8_SOLVR|nr:hypothetical protein MTR67_018887 [Solanum verrucosum]
MTELLYHLFFECEYSTNIWGSILLTWIKGPRQIGNWEDELQWVTTRGHKSRPLAEILGWLYATSVYNIWNERNSRRFSQQHTLAANRLKKICLQLHTKGHLNLKWKPILDHLNAYHV